MDFQILENNFTDFFKYEDWGNAPKIKRIVWNEEQIKMQILVVTEWKMITFYRKCVHTY